MTTAAVELHSVPRPFFSRISAEAIPRLLALIAKSADPGDEAEPEAEDDGALFGAAEAAGVDVFAVIREEPGNVSVKTIEREVFKLTAIRAVGLPDAFGSTNTVRAPMMQALTLIKRYKADVSNRIKCYALGENVPVEGIIPAELVELMYRADSKKRQRILRTVYECGVFQTLREKLRCKEIWVVGADRWRNPDDDLPKDFEANRAENYAKLRKPLDPQVFVDQLREEMDAELSALNDALGGKGLAWLKIAERRNAGAIQLTPLDAAPEPRNRRRLKAAIRDRWGVVPLMDMLTETALRTGCLNVFTPTGTQNHLDAQVLFERLLLLIYAYGTGTGIRAVAAGDHPHTEDDLRYARRRYLTVQACREVARIDSHGASFVGFGITRLLDFDLVARFKQSTR